jgi:hypothetical protein
MTPLTQVAMMRRAAGVRGALFSTVRVGQGPRSLHANRTA